jgi:hypothetical protein
MELLRQAALSLFLYPDLVKNMRSRFLGRKAGLPWSFKKPGTEWRPIRLRAEEIHSLLKFFFGQAWWYLSVIPATQKVETRGSRPEASSGKVSIRPYLKNELRAKGVGACLKWQCSRSWVQSSVPQGEKTKVLFLSLFFFFSRNKKG